MLAACARPLPHPDGAAANATLGVDPFALATVAQADSPTPHGGNPFLSARPGTRARRAGPQPQPS
jgi:hypothetical protein